MVQTLIAKFGAFWPPFDAHLRASGVPLHEMDSDTDWARLLEEVEWPTGLCPNVAQQSALKFALRAFCSRRDAELESSSGDGGAAKIGRTSRRVLESFLPPVLGTNEEQDSRKPPAPTPLLRVPNRRILIGHQGLIPGRPEDEHTARLLEDCLRGRPASATVSFGSSRPLLRALPRTAPPWTGAKPGNPPEVDLHRLADTLLDWEPTGARTLAPIRLFPSTPSDNDDASRLADALLKENGSTPGATPLAVARAVKGVAITAETCPAILNATEQALDRLTKSEFHAFKDVRGQPLVQTVVSVAGYTHCARVANRVFPRFRNSIQLRRPRNSSVTWNAVSSFFSCASTVVFSSFSTWHAYLCFRNY